MHSTNKVTLTLTDWEVRALRTLVYRGRRDYFYGLDMGEHLGMFCHEWTTLYNKTARAVRDIEETA